MEWATHGHGAAGRVHADRRTVEYHGRGNHKLDAACFRSRSSVGDWCRGADVMVGGAEETTTTTTTAGAAAPAATSALPTRRRQRPRAMEDVMGIPVFYYETTILATRHFHGDPSPIAGNGVASEHDLPTVADDLGEGDDGDEAATTVDEWMLRRRGHDGPTSPWRARARALIHEHLRATRPSTLAIADGFGDDGRQGPEDSMAIEEGGEVPTITTAASTTDATTGAEGQNHHDGADDRGINVDEEMTEADDHPLGGLPAASTMMLPLPMSSGTIQQFRVRLQRQQLRDQFHQRARRRSSLSTATHLQPSTATPLLGSSKKRWHHRIAVGFTFRKDRAGDGDSPPRAGNSLEQPGGSEDLGKQAFSVALVGKTGCVISNGQEYGRTETRFGHGDTVGCGVVLDTRTFFWTINGVLVANVLATSIHHFDDLEDEMVDVKDTGDEHGHCLDDDASGSWLRRLHPAVSLHEQGECVRAMFEPPKDGFRFDLEGFVQQQQRDRQRCLSAFVSSQPRAAPCQQQHEDETLHALVRDYFEHYGYRDALNAIDQVHADPESPPLSEVAASLNLRHEVRRHIYAFNTEEAMKLLLVKGCLPFRQLSLSDHLKILQVVDALRNHSPDGDQWNPHAAIMKAREAFAQEENGSSDCPLKFASNVSLIMCMLLYPSERSVPENNPGREFLTWSFREQVADEVNEELLQTKPLDVAMEESPHIFPALEVFLNDFAGLQQTCLQSGHAIFPNHDGDPKSARRHSTHKHRRHHHRRGSVHASATAAGIIIEVDDDDDDDEAMAADSSSMGSGSEDSAENDEDDDDAED